MPWLALVLAAALLLPTGGWSSQLPENSPVSRTIVITDTEQFNLAQTLYDKKLHASAAHEFVRFYHLFPNGDKATQARFRAGEAFFKAGMLTDAQRLFHGLATPFRDTEPAREAVFKLAEIHVARKNPGNAVIELKNLARLTSEVRVRDRACFILAWLLIDNAHWLKSQSQGKMNPMVQARTYMGKISPQGREKYQMEPLAAQLDRMEALPEKNPTLAGCAAIIPGGGFLYTERYQDALVSFLLNSALILAGYQAFDNDQEYLGGLLLFVEAGFYAGNIYGSISSAHKHNRRQREAFIQKVKSDYTRLLEQVRIQPQQNGASLHFSLPF
ncbi:MAG: hypothetical protein MI747_21430 [Desulfobacterales bacterium]|nr:hypothetical protein [Desulfobacterales bacterium]